MHDLPWWMKALVIAIVLAGGFLLGRELAQTGVPKSHEECRESVALRAYHGRFTSYEARNNAMWACEMMDEARRAKR